MLIESQWSEFISDSQKNVIMNHTINHIFIIYYCTWYHISLQEIMCGLESDKMFSWVLT